MRNTSNTRKVSAAALVAVILMGVVIYFVQRTPPAESPPRAVSETQTADGERSDSADEIAATEPNTDPATETEPRTSVADEPADDESAIAVTNVLRVVLEGVTEEDAQMTTVTLSGLHERDKWPAVIGDSWPCEGLTNDYELDPILALLERREDLLDRELEVAVEHPHLLGERARVSVKPTKGKNVHEVRVRLVPPEYWRSFTLAVRDAHTLKHLRNVELRIASGPALHVWGRNSTGTWLGDGLSSPIALMGGRDARDPRPRVAGMALAPAADESPRLVELARRWSPERGVAVSARAPGYAWGGTQVDVSQGERELLLEPAAALEVRLANVQLERYAALGVVPMLCVHWIREDGGNQNVHYARLDETLENEGLRLESLVPGGYRVVVELGGGVWRENPVLGRGELSGQRALAVGETRQLVLTLDDPPAPPELATLGGVVSFPAPTATWGDEKARLQIYHQPTQRWRDPHFEFSLADLQPVGGALPSWSFRVEDLPVGLYRIQLMPFLKVWMIDLTADGRGDLELLLPELAEVVVETVDGETGERVPRDELYYRFQEPHPRQTQNDFTRADTEEPGRFRFWAVPGKVMIWPRWPSGPDRGLGTGKELDLKPGLQSVRLVDGPFCNLRFEFRVDGVALPIGGAGMSVVHDIRAVDHEGRVSRLQRNLRVELSAPGLYEIGFEDLDTDRFQAVPPRRVDVRAGETTDVIVDLQLK